MTIIMLLIMAYLGWMAWRLHRVFFDIPRLTGAAVVIAVLIIIVRFIVREQHDELQVLVSILFNYVLAFLAYAVGNGLARKFAARPMD
jgi:hypothetical protein